MIWMTLLVGINLFAHSQAPCIPAREFVPHEHLGEFFRVHPTGEFILQTASAFVPQSPTHILDLRNKDGNGVRKVKIIPTALGPEAYPVEGNWEFVTAPNNNGMEYVRFKDMQDLTDARRVQASFTDANFNGVYHSVAELPGSNPNVKTIRTTRWSNRTRDTKITYGPNGSTQVEFGDMYTLCRNIVYEAAAHAKDGKGLDRIKDVELSQLEREALEVNLEKLRYDRLGDQQKIKSEITEIDKKIKAINSRISSVNPKYMDNPILSKDGTRVAVVMETSSEEYEIHVYKINYDKSCTLIAQTGYRGSKVNFSYPEAGKEPKIGFTIMAGSQENFKRRAVIFDLNTKNAQLIDEDVAHSYIAFTRDGRVVLGLKDGFAFLDPNQLSGGSGRCIRQTKGSEPAAESATSR